MASQENDTPTGGRPPVSVSPLIADEDPQDNPVADLEEVRDYCLQLLHELDWDLGPEYLTKIAEIRKRIEKAGDWTELLEAAGVLRKKLTSFARLLMSEREDSSSFIIEVVRRLGEAEAHLKASAQGTAAIYKESEGFASSVLGNVGEIQSKTRSSSSLGEIKGLVLDGLDKFKTVLQSHRDQQRRHIRTVTTQLDQMRNRFRSLQDRVSEIEQENQDLSSRLREDPLTGAHNRLALEERISQELGLVRRDQQIFSVLMVDIDHFKRVNDTYGHSVGDQCLIEIVAKLKQGLRVSDMLARYGGEEFAVVLPASSDKEALATAEKLRQSVAETDFTVRGSRIPVTVSIGSTQALPLDAAPTDVLHRADQALYEAKNAGRNTVKGL